MRRNLRPQGETIIVTRHAALVEWLARKGITGKVVAHATPELVSGQVVYGVLPLHLACLCWEVYTVDFPKLQEGKRGHELTAAEMDAAGAVLRGYEVHALGVE